ncbi:MAG: hypothetical protein ACLTRS_02810 [Lachnospiraceae bacterium]
MNTDEYGSVCGFDLQLEGCHYRRLSALDKDEVVAGNCARGK